VCGEISSLLGNAALEFSKRGNPMEKHFKVGLSPRIGGPEKHWQK
jgi:hypothetical protein